MLRAFLIDHSGFAFVLAFLLSLIMCIQDRMVVVAVVNGSVVLLSVSLLIVDPREGRPLFHFSAKLFCWAAMLAVLAATTALPKAVVSISAFALAYSGSVVLKENRDWAEVWLGTFVLLLLIYAGGMVEFVPRNKPHVQRSTLESSAPVSLRLYPPSAPAGGYSENEFSSLRWQNQMSLDLYKPLAILLWRTGILHLEEESTKDKDDFVGDRRDEISLRPSGERRWDSGDTILNSRRRVDLAGQDVYSGTMARLARVVVSGVAYRVTQRGNRRQPTFFQEDDYQAYLDRIEERLGRVVRPAKRGPKPRHEGN